MAIYIYFVTQARDGPSVASAMDGVGATGSLCRTGHLGGHVIFLQRLSRRRVSEIPNEVCLGRGGKAAVGRDIPKVWLFLNDGSVDKALVILLTYLSWSDNQLMRGAKSARHGHKGGWQWQLSIR